MIDPYVIPSPPPDWQPERVPRPKIDPATAKLVQRAPAKCTVVCVGCSFAPGYPDDLLELGAEVGPDADLAGIAWLERDPSNEHDPNAVRVVVYTAHVAHLPRAVAAKVAPVMDVEGDGGYIITGWRVNISWAGATKHPGLEIDIERTGQS